MEQTVSVPNKYILEIDFKDSMKSMQVIKDHPRLCFDDEIDCSMDLIQGERLFIVESVCIYPFSNNEADLPRFKLSELADLQGIKYQTGEKFIERSECSIINLEVDLPPKEAIRAFEQLG